MDKYGIILVLVDKEYKLNGYNGVGMIIMKGV